MSVRTARSRGRRRTWKLLAGTLLSGVGISYGLWLRENTSPILAVGPGVAGIYVLMHMVADDLVPGASPTVTGFLKLTTVLVFFSWATWLIWT